MPCGTHSSLLNENKELKDFLKYLFDNRKKEITDGLLEYHKDAGGSPIIPGFEIVECTYDNSSHSGKVKFKYAVFFTFGCADLHPSETATETSKFEIDTTNKTLVLFLTDYMTRDTLDEF